VKSKYSLPNCATRTHKAPTRIQNQLPRQFKSSLGAHRTCTKSSATPTSGCINTSGTIPNCLSTTASTLHLACCPVALALLQLRRALQLLVTGPHSLYVNLVVRREYSSPGHSGSTSTTSYAAVTSSSGCTTTSTTIWTSKLVENGFRSINN
jgi:hypothetical protein